MTNPGTGAPGADGWKPLPQGEYDSDATAFVQLPPEGFPDAAPLAAPGHGYVPPQMTVSPATGAAATDPAATGVWVLPQDLIAPASGAGGDASQVGAAPVSWPVANQEPYEEPYEEPRHEGAYQAGPGQTGQWSIPVANGDLPDESGEFTQSSLAAQWGDRTPPPTLPGGAPAPWASEPWAQPEAAEAPSEPEPEPVAEVVPEPVAEVVPDPVEAAVPEPVEAAAGVPEPAEPADSTEDAEAPAEGADAAEGTDEAEAAEAAEVTETAPDPSAALPLHDDHPLVSYVLRVNGTDRPVTDAWIGESLLYVLRERLGLAGAKDGCSQGECGACNVQVDGRLVASCLVPSATAAGSEVRTVEGLAEDGQPSDVQRALAACGAVQCGFCVPGMAMTVHDLLEGNPNPTDLETRQALCGNLCRCSGYRGVLDAVRQVSAERKASADDAAEPADDELRIPHQAGPAHGELFQDGGQA
ncbi:2Fe-2S iron-sulfur cluster-binding protein [Streptomyces sp. NPDC052225]|uniref:2Fe-2S iron-sulfur cluster-binding protein n=1 Tax=Streptomyces sp. NPDC052225 TaxID=3154949 RepID=UPI00343BF706